MKPGGLQNHMVLVEVAKVADIAEGKGKGVTSGEKQMAIFNVGGKFYAISKKCTHAGGPLDDGLLEGFIVTCPWHGSKFDIRTGKVVNGPATKDAEVHKVKVDGQSVKVEV